MNEYGQFRDAGIDIEHIKAGVEPPAFREAMRAGGVTVEEAAAALRAHAQHFDVAEFEAQIAAHRPKLWLRMNRHPSRVRSAVRRLTRNGAAGS